MWLNSSRVRRITIRLRITCSLVHIDSYRTDQSLGFVFSAAPHARALQAGGMAQDLRKASVARGERSSRFRTQSGLRSRRFGYSDQQKFVRPAKTFSDFPESPRRWYILSSQSPARRHLSSPAHERLKLHTGVTSTTALRRLSAKKSCSNISKSAVDADRPTCNADTLMQPSKVAGRKGKPVPISCWQRSPKLHRRTSITDKRREAHEEWVLL